jgi:hypothetical protein
MYYFVFDIDIPDNSPGPAIIIDHYIYTDAQTAKKVSKGIKLCKNVNRSVVIEMSDFEIYRANYFHPQNFNLSSANYVIKMKIKVRSIRYYSIWRQKYFHYKTCKENIRQCLDNMIEEYIQTRTMNGI